MRMCGMLCHQDRNTQTTHTTTHTTHITQQQEATGATETATISLPNCRQKFWRKKIEAYSQLRATL